MKKRFSLLLLSLLALLALYAWQCLPSAAKAEYRILSPEPRLVVVQVDFTPAETAAHSSLWALARWRNPWWAWGHEGRAVQWRRPYWERQLRDIAPWRVSGHAVRRLGFWKAPVGQSRPGGSPVLGADVVHHVFLELDVPLREGERVEVMTPFGRCLEFVRRESLPTPFIKVNQAGYAASASRRYAYVGGWLGSAGRWRPPADVKSYELIDADTHEVVCTGDLMRRTEAEPTKDGVPWIGEETLCADLSDPIPEGSYVLRVPGVGCSLPFSVSDESIWRALGVHMHGLFVQRCGSPDKRKPRTAWEDGPCHLQVWRGSFPPEVGDYSSGRFLDSEGNPVKVEPFDLIARNTDWAKSPESFPGGWHDAADYDRRPFHLQIVSDLAAVCLFRGDRLPADVREEAAWGLEHLRRAQTSEGAVGGWIESVRHPTEGEGLPSADRLGYALSRPTRTSTLAYAAVASELARTSPAMKTRFLDSAQRAWECARSTEPATNVPFVVSSEGGVRTVFWSESQELPVKDELKAAVNLAAATGDSGYLDVLGSDRFLRRFQEALAREGRGWSPFSLLEVFLLDDSRLDPYRDRLLKWLVTNGEKSLSAQEDQPYRLPRPNGEDLAWGHSHPLSIARGLLAAYAVSGRKDFLSAAYLANDFHCGCNPDGMTMTSGLGVVYPVRFLSLASTADDVAEYVAGITPYRWTYGVGMNDYRLVHTDAEVAQWPIWRRRVSLEALNVPSGEYTVWETIGPAAAVTAWLASEGKSAPAALTPPVPNGRPEDLAGYWALP